MTAVYLVIGYFKYEGCEPISIHSTLDKAIDVCKVHVKWWDGTEVYEYTLDSDEEGKEVYKEINRV